MTLSQNGWPARENTKLLTRFTAAGQGWWAANPDCAVVAAEFISRFDKEVEEITGPVLDDWSYANRMVRGSTSVVSNHGSATAWDVNALKHPRGKHDTFTPKQQKAMRQIQSDITDNSGMPVLRLGMDYTTTVDDMHVEVNASAARVKQAADKIRNRNRIQEDELPTPKDVWNADLIPHNKTDDKYAPTDPHNPTWKPISIMEETNRLVRELVEEVKQLRAEVRAKP